MKSLNEEAGFPLNLVNYGRILLMIETSYHVIKLNNLLFQFFKWTDKEQNNNQVPSPDFHSLPES